MIHINVAHAYEIPTKSVAFTVHDILHRQS